METTFYKHDGKKWVLKEKYGYRLEWYDVENKYHVDVFVKPNTLYADVDVSYVHKWDNPEEGLRKFLTHVPLNNTTISLMELV